MIEREEIKFLAAADFTDDCRVSVQLRKRRTTMTVPEARAFRRELDVAIGEASRAADDLLHRDVPPAGFDMLLGPEPTDVEEP
ncbi:hypothetical protein [Microbacterium soli]|uniref:Uncharacterized protein n=1 Tax=Microbacterium soli TaxID=446075 RepID=A0ABP7NIT3_9MICO